MLILVFDTETTGFLHGRLPIGHSDQPKIVQLAAVLCREDQTEVMRLDVVIYQDVVPAESTKAHGLTEEFVKAVGVNEGAALSLFEDMLSIADIVVAHNIDYDRKVVTNAVRLLDGTPDTDPFAGKQLFCTMKAATPILKLPRKSGGIKSPSLTECVKHLLGRDHVTAHTAIGDVLETKNIFFKLQEIVRK
jgi:DNA polymerase-3 subunit epsilon